MCYSESNVEDIDTDAEDHIYDECRYVLMEHVIAPRILSTGGFKTYDPLDAEDNYYAQQMTNNYNFYTRL